MEKNGNAGQLKRRLQRSRFITGGKRVGNQRHSFWRKPRARSITVVEALLTILSVLLVGCHTKKQTYTLHQEGITYTGMAGLHVSQVPGLDSYPDCPEDLANPDAGCIVCYQPLGDGRVIHDRLAVTITCSQNGQLVYSATSDPREFTAPRLKPGAYDLAMTGDSLETNYIFQSVTVLPHQATLVPITVRPK